MISRADIQCPGDIIPYNCSILSNSETIHLIWLITIPGMMPVNITYSNMTSGSNNLTPFISTSVTDFQNDEFIQSTLKFTVQPSIPTLQFNIVCAITGLGLNTTVVRVNSSCKSIRTMSYYSRLHCNILVQFLFHPPILA